MRNPRTAAILKTMAKDNARLRNQEDFKSTIDVMGKTPDFVTSNPAMQKWWTDFAPKGVGYDNPAAMPDGGKSFQTGMGGVLTQAQAAQQAKVVTLAAKTHTSTLPLNPVTKNPCSYPSVPHGASWYASPTIT